MGLEQSREENKGLRSNTNPTKRRTQITVPYIKRPGGKFQEHMQKIWYSSIFQRRQNHQGPPDGTQGQRSDHSKKWHHL